MEAFKKNFPARVAEVRAKHQADLETEVAQSTPQIIVDGDRLRLWVSSIRSF